MLGQKRFLHSKDLQNAETLQGHISEIDSSQGESFKGKVLSLVNLVMVNGV